jgi:hypothetical protein
VTGEGALHVTNQIADHPFGDLELSVVEQLEQERRQQVVVGRSDRDRGRRAQARGEIRQADRPGGDRPARGQQQMPALLGQPIVQLQERHLVGDRLGRIEDGGARHEIGGRQGGRVEPAGGRACRPDPGQMALAAARRAMQDQGRGRPGGPALQPSERIAIAGRRHEVLAPGCGLVLEGEQQLLARAHGPASAEGGGPNIGLAR